MALNWVQRMAVWKVCSMDDERGAAKVYYWEHWSGQHWEQSRENHWENRKDNATVQNLVMRWAPTVLVFYFRFCRKRKFFLVLSVQ